jgi:hypothetical protein
MSSGLRRGGRVFLFAAIAGGAAAQGPVDLSDEPIPPMWVLGGPFTPPVLIQDFPAIVGLGDATGDGNVDLIVAAAPNLYAGNGHGRFTPVPGATAAASLAIPSSAARRVVGDWDGDGKVDVAQSTGFLVSIYLSSGTTGPALTQTIPAGDGALAAGDFDLDGDLDLVLTLPPIINQAGTTPQAARLYLNNGAGFFTFAAGTTLPAGDGASVAAGDFDGDLDVDIVLSVAGGFAVVSNLGGGVFSAPAPYAIGIGGPFNVAFANFGGDALPDLFVRGQNAGFWFGYSNTPGGIFTPTWSRPGLGGVFDVRVADIDSDGVSEYVVAALNGVYILDGTGSPTTTTRLAPAYCTGLDLADIDADGDLDCVFEARTRDILSPSALPLRAFRVLFNDGLGGMTLFGPGLLPRDLASSAVVGDFTNDGAPDLLALEDTGFSSSPLIGAINDGYGRFEWYSPPCAPCPPFPNAATSATTLDFDGDGLLDVAWHHRPTSGGHSIVVHTNLGGGAFTAAVQIPLSGNLTGLVAFDADGDGLPDLLSGESIGVGLRLLKNTGGTFAAPVALGVVGVFDLEVVDVDSDGDRDVVVAGNVSKLLLNDGTGTFAVDAAFPGVFALRTSSWNVDGVPGAEVFLDGKLYRRETTGAWTLLADIPSGAGAGSDPFEYAASDFDGDGDVEIATGAGFLYELVPGGAIVVRTLPFLALQDPLVVADFDRDGGADLLTTRSTLLHNATRRIVLESPVRPGRPSHVRVQGAPNGLYFLFGSLPPIGGPFAAAPYGSIFVDTGSLVLFAAGALDANGKATPSSFVSPSAAAAIGFEFVLQAVVDAPAGPRLTNARKAKIEGY